MSGQFSPGFASAGTFSPDTLIAGDFPIRTRGVTVLSGQALERGAVVGQVTASGKYVLCDPAAENGSEDPKGIVIAPVDASAGDAVGMIYISGDFNENDLTIGGTGTADDIRDALRAISIFLHKAVSA